MDRAALRAAAMGEKKEGGGGGAAADGGAGAAASRALQQCGQLQKLIDISLGSLRGLRTKCAVSNDLTQQEIRTLEVSRGGGARGSATRMGPRSGPRALLPELHPGAGSPPWMLPPFSPLADAAPWGPGTGAHLEQVLGGEGTEWEPGWGTEEPVCGGSLLAPSSHTPFPGAVGLIVSRSHALAFSPRA